MQMQTGGILGVWYSPSYSIPTLRYHLVGHKFWSVIDKVAFGVGTLKGAHVPDCLRE